MRRSALSPRLLSAPVPSHDPPWSARYADSNLLKSAPLMHFADQAFIAETTAKMLLEVKAVLFFQDKPFIFTSGWASPVYIDCRKLIFYPRIRSQLVDFAAATLARDVGFEQFDVVAGGETAHSLCGVDRRAPRAADAIREEEAEGLRPQRADRGRHPRGRAHAAGRGPHHRRALEDQFLQGAARGGRDRRARVRQLLLRHLPRVEEDARRAERAPASSRHLVGRARAGEEGRLPRVGANRRSREVSARAGAVVGGARRGLRFPIVLRVVTLNVNGIRSAAKKGLFRWLAAQRADVVCLQEMKCQQTDLDARLHGLKAFEACHAFAQKKGYSGVALYSRRAPDEVRRGFDSREFDAEGRYVEARFGRLWVVSVYLPSGSAGAHRQKSKFRFLKVFLKHLMKLRQRGCEIILCGDWNIAHQEIDLRNWR